MIKKSFKDIKVDCDEFSLSGAWNLLKKLLPNKIYHMKIIPLRDHVSTHTLDIKTKSRWMF